MSKVSSIPSESHVASFERFLSTITQRFGDPTFSILKAHLLFEEMLRGYLERRLPNPKALVGARLTFAQVLALVRCLQPPGPDDWQWEAVAKLNSLRNQFSHHLKPDERDAKIGEYITFVTSRYDEPLPQPAGSSSVPPSTGGPFYQAIDMVNAKLFGSIGARLGFQSL
jgi:hypothetical protein